MFKIPALRIANSGQKKQLTRHFNESEPVTASYYTQGARAPSGFSDRNRVGNAAFTIGGVDITTPYIDDIPHPLKCDMYKDIYVHDPVAGAAIDLLSNLPWSDFNIRIPNEDKDEKIRDIFEENLNRLRINTLLASATREHLVFGAHISLLIYNHAEKLFTDTLPFEYRETEITSNILYGRDPLIRVTVSQEQKEFIKSISSAAQSIKERLNPKLLQLLKAETFEIDPLSSIYFPRKTFSTTDRGVSVYQRILPIYLLEKVLLRGTITMANRRQSSIMHIQAGSDEWEATRQDLDALISMVVDADRDPIGSTVATRQDVNINEIRSGGDFWKWNDVSEELNQRKLLALGISDVFLSGEASYNSLEHALTVFIEQLKAFRTQASNQFFYNKLFPLIAMVNGFTISESETAALRNRAKYSNMIDYNIADKGSLIIPTIEWEKKLMPEGDEERLNVMQTLAEKGVPFSLRAWAAAGGYDLDQLARESENSISVEEKIQDIMKLREKKLGPPKDTEEFSKEESSLELPETTLPEIGLIRDYPEDSMELTGKSKTGKRKYVPNQHRKNDEFNKMVASALTRLHKIQ